MTVGLVPQRCGYTPLKFETWLSFEPLFPELAYPQSDLESIDPWIIAIEAGV